MNGERTRLVVVAGLDREATGAACDRYPDPFGSWHSDPCDDLDVEDSATPDIRKDRA